MKILPMLYVLLNSRERKQLAGIALGMVLLGIIQTGGVASVLPFMRLVAEPSVLQGEGWPAELYDRIGFSSPDAALFAAGVAMLVIIATSNALSALGVWVVSRWGWGLNHRLATTLLGRYMRRPYAFFLGRNTAELNRTVLSEVGSVVTGVLLPALQVAARSISALLIVLLLALVDAGLAALVAITFGGAYAIVYVFLRRSQQKAGRERFVQNGRRFKIAGEALTGIKDVKTLGREDEFLRRFSEPSRRFASAAALSQAVSRAPGYALETIGFGAIVLIVITNIQSGSDIARILPLLSLYAFAAYRLMPAINAIFSGVLTIRFNAAALDALHQDLCEGTEPLGSAPSSDFDLSGGASSRASVSRERGPVPSDDEWEGFREIELRGVGFRYPGTREPTLTNLDLRIQANEVVGFVGQTGAGKTTLVDLILGLFLPSEGAVLVNGEALDPGSAAAWRTHCGYVPQDVFLADDTVTNNIAFGVREEEISPDAVETASRVAQLHDFVAALPAGYGTLVGERGIRMSGGQRQRIGIARALYRDPDVLVLDEATSALDGVTESAVLQTVQTLVRRKTIMIVAHRLTTVKACDVIYVMEDGGIVANGSYESLLLGHRGFQAMAGKLPQ